MQSRIQQNLGIPAENSIRKEYLRAFELFQEFSGRSISETIEERRASHNHHHYEIEKQAEEDVTKFYNWLREVKNIPIKIAYYYSISLKSLLSGLPTGVAVGLLFGIILDTSTQKTTKNA
ncbi:MAG: hypothetical protein PVH12_08770 [Candidatus Bathyarchaeota archaeon]|jgi:hypothetical protein